MRNPPIIAIVDDDDGVRASLTSLVRSLGYDVRSYGSALEFLNDQSSGEPDCMISDIQMPQLSGDELQDELIATGRDIPMIFMTAFPTQSTRDRVMAAGACGFLEKPADGEVIADLLTTALQARRS